MPRRKPVTWPKALDAYEVHLRARRAATRTLEGHRRDLDHLRLHLRPLKPGQVRLDDLRTYQLGLLTGEASRTGKPLSAGTVARMTSTLRAFFSFLVDEGLLPSSPAERLERPRLPQRPPGDVLDTKEVRRLLGAADETVVGVRDKTLIETLYSTGVRRAELLALDLGDLDHGERTLLVRCGKGEKARLIPINRTCYAALRVYLEESRPELVKKSSPALFLTTLGHRMHNVGLLRVLRRMAQRAGISKRVTPHCLRRSFATGLMKNGASLKAIQTLLGHANLNTTAAYLCLDTSDLRKEILLRHPRERFEA